MASIQRMIRSGIRLYNHNPRAINFATSPINRIGALANPYRSLCSSSCGDGHSIRTFKVDTSAMVNALKEDGIPLKRAEAITSSLVDFLADLERNSTEPCASLLCTKFKRLRKNIKFDKDPEIKRCMSRCDDCMAKRCMSRYDSMAFVALVICGTFIWSKKIDVENDYKKKLYGNAK